MPMSRIEASVLVRRPLSEVFAFLASPGNHAAFVPGMLQFQQTSPGAFGQVGARARGLRRVLGRRVGLPYEVIEFQPGASLALEGSLGPLTFRDGYVLQTEGEATRVQFWLEPSLRGLMRLAQPFVTLIGRAHATETLANLKRSLEGAPRSAE